MRRSEGQNKGTTYCTADGGTIANKGEFDIVYSQLSSDAVSVMNSATFQNADVGMPIFSVNHITKDKHEVTFREHDGYILHVPSGRKFFFTCISDVYFIKMRVPKALIGNGGFTRPGAVA